MRLSILLPFRNAAATLPDCLQSIAQQTHNDFQLLAVDDGSSDDSVAIVQSFAQQGLPTRLIDTGGVGLIPALNMGLEQSSEELIARMDADDIMRPTRLVRQQAFLDSHPHMDLVACQTNKFPEHRVKAGYREYIRWQNTVISPEDIRHELYVESPLPHPSVMFRREVIMQAGGYRDGDFPEDYELWLRLNAAGIRMGKVAEVLLDWRESEDRLSRVDPRYAREAFDRLRADYLAQDSRLKGARTIAIWGAGRPTRKRAAHLLAKGIELCAWIDIDPKKIGNRLQGVPVVSPDWLKRDDKPFVLIYVNNHGARDLIAADLANMGYARGKDWLAVG